MPSASKVDQLDPGSLNRSPARANLRGMEDIRISLSDRQQAFLDEQVASGDYASASEYVGALIDAEAKAKAQEKLEALLLEALDEEGEDEEWTDADWEALRRRAAGV
jgi:putative addiction module CopG family antidote